MEALHIFLLFAMLASESACYRHKRDACIKGNTPNIPPKHLFFAKKQPLILGHRGQAKKFQENTMEGIKSVEELGADGFEVDVYLTDFNQLVLFPSDNAKRLTGINKNIWQMIPSKVKNLKYKTLIPYGNITYHYDRPRHVVLLEDVFKEFKDGNMIIDIEMKPTTWENKARSEATGREVAKLIRQYNLENKVLLTSLDALKLRAAVKENPRLVIGTYLLKRYYVQNSAWYADLKSELRNLPGLGKCLDRLPTNRSLVEFLFETGSLSKSLNMSFIEFELGLFADKSLMKTPVNMLKDNYNRAITFGASTIYSMALDERGIESYEKAVQSLVQQKVARLITDDVPRLMKLLGRKKPSGSTNPMFGSFMIVCSSCFLSLIISLVI